MYDVIAIGEVLIDFTCMSQDDSGYPVMSAHPGGAPANYLAALAKYGAKAAMISKVGNDAFGRLLVNTISEAGIDTSGICVAEDVFTTLAFVTLDETGNREFSFARKPGADTCMRFEETDPKLIDAAKVVHFGTLSLTDEPSLTTTVRLIEYAKAHGKLISFDPNLRKPLWRDLADAKRQMLWGLKQSDVVKISDDEIEFLFGVSPEEGLNLLLDQYNVRLAFVTCGKDGCVFGNRAFRGSSRNVPAVNVVDTTGAGDIFGGSAMWKLLQTGKAPEDLCEAELREIAGFACTAATLSTRAFGGISSVPSLDDVMAQMEK